MNFTRRKKTLLSELIDSEKLLYGSAMNSIYETNRYSFKPRAFNFGVGQTKR